jgi:energy-coupling factor transport system ATP-binding protein
VLLADGRVIADGTAAELLAGGWYFATETARILAGAGGALLPEQGAELLRERAAHVEASAGAPGARAEGEPVADLGEPSTAPAVTIAPGVAR